MVLQDLMSAYDRDELNVSPWYQRRPVWTNAHKSYLINSIFVTMPVPTIYIRHTLDLEKESTVKEVVDGQQRCRSIIDFRENKFTARHPNHSRRIYYRDLRSSERHDFLMSKLPVAYLIGADDSDVIEIFGRLNAVARTLNAQEKRAAKWSGEFHQFCLKEATARLALWRGLSIFSATQISRMAEVQFTAELSLALIEGMTDFSAARVDHAYMQWDDQFEEGDDVGKRFERIYGKISALQPDVIKETIFSRSPVFYSLLLVLDSLGRLPKDRDLEAALIEIDGRFKDPRPAAERPKADVDFGAACTASTQRIKSRQTRFDYINSFM